MFTAAGLDRRLVTGIFVLGLLTCLWSGYLFGPSGDDTEDYLQLAQNIRSGNGFSLAKEAPFVPSASRTPLYPLFLVGIFAVFGENRLALLATQAVLLALTWVILADLGARLFGRATGRCVGLLASLNPYLCRWAGSTLTEGLYLFLTVACVAAFVRALEGQHAKWWAATGVLWGVGTLTRPASVVLLPTMVAALWMVRPKPVRPWMAAALLTFCGGLTLAPWTIRNAVLFREFIPLQARAFGINFWLTTIDWDEQPRATWVGCCREFSTKYPEWAHWISSTNDAAALKDAESRLARAGLQRVLADPLRYVSYRLRSYPGLWVHSGRLWFGDVSFRDALTRKRYDVLLAKAATATLLSLAPLLLAAWGAWHHRLTWRRWLPLSFVPAYIALVHLPLWIEDRYGTPAVPFILVMSAAALAGRRRTREPSIQAS